MLNVLSAIIEFVYSNIRLEISYVLVFCKMSLFNLLFFESLKMPGNKYRTLEPSPFIYNFIVSSTFIMTFQISSLMLWQESLIGYCLKIQQSILPH